MRQFSTLSFVIVGIAIVGAAKLHHDNIAIESHHGRSEIIVAPPNQFPPLRHDRRIEGGGVSSQSTQSQDGSPYWWAGSRNPFNYVVCKPGDVNCKSSNANNLGPIPPNHQRPRPSHTVPAGSNQQRPKQPTRSRPQGVTQSHIPRPRPKSPEVTVLEIANDQLKEQVRVQQLQLQQQQIDYQRELEKQIMNLLKQQSGTRVASRPSTHRNHQERINQLMGPMGICPTRFICVHWQLCSEGYVIADGSGIIDKNIGAIPQQVSSSYESCGGDMICCGIPVTVVESVGSIFEPQNLNDFDLRPQSHPEFTQDPLSNVPAFEGPLVIHDFTPETFANEPAFEGPLVVHDFIPETFANDPAFESPQVGHDFTLDVSPDVPAFEIPVVDHDQSHFDFQNDPTRTDFSSDHHRENIPVHTLKQKHPQHISDRPVATSFDEDRFQTSGPQLNIQIPHVSHPQPDLLNPLFTDHQTDHVESVASVSEFPESGISFDLSPPHHETFQPDEDLLPPHVSPVIDIRGDFHASHPITSKTPQELLHTPDTNFGVNLPSLTPGHREELPGIVKPSTEDIRNHLKKHHSQQDPHISPDHSKDNVNLRHPNRHTHEIPSRVPDQRVSSTLEGNIEIPRKPLLNSQDATRHSSVPSQKQPSFPSLKHNVPHHDRQDSLGQDFNNHHQESPIKIMPLNPFFTDHQDAIVEQEPSRFSDAGIPAELNPPFHEAELPNKFGPPSKSPSFNRHQVTPEQNNFSSDFSPNTPGSERQHVDHRTPTFNIPAKFMPTTVTRSQVNVPHKSHLQNDFASVSSNNRQDSPVKIMPLNPLFTDHQDAAVGSEPSRFSEAGIPVELNASFHETELPNKFGTPSRSPTLNRHQVTPDIQPGHVDDFNEPSYHSNSNFHPDQTFNPNQPSHNLNKPLSPTHHTFHESVIPAEEFKRQDPPSHVSIPRENTHPADIINDQKYYKGSKPQHSQDFQPRPGFSGHQLKDKDQKYYKDGKPQHSHDFDRANPVRQPVGVRNDRPNEFLNNQSPPFNRKPVGQSGRPSSISNGNPQDGQYRPQLNNKRINEHSTNNHRVQQSLLNSPNRHSGNYVPSHLRPALSVKPTGFPNEERQNFNNPLLPAHLQGNPFFSNQQLPIFLAPGSKNYESREIHQGFSPDRPFFGDDQFHHFSPGQNFQNPNLANQNNRFHSAAGPHSNKFQGNIPNRFPTRRVSGSNFNRGNSGLFKQAGQPQNGLGGASGGLMTTMVIRTPLGTPLTEDGGMCSASSYCVMQQECNPYNGFIVMDPYERTEQWKRGPRVPRVRCIVPGGIQSGVCCQLPHPIVGPNGHLLD